MLPLLRAPLSYVFDLVFCLCMYWVIFPLFYVLHTSPYKFGTTDYAMAFLYDLYKPHRHWDAAPSV